MFLRHGDHGPEVQYLQERLSLAGFLPGPADGVFGPQTDRAVRQFQASRNLKVDGIVGDQTWSALLAGPVSHLPDALLASQKDALLLLVSGEHEAHDVVRAAIRTLGWQEQPDGSNDGPLVGQITSGYYSSADEQRLGKPPWCALAICFWMTQGLKVGYRETPFGARLGAVSQMEHWAKTRDRFRTARIATQAPQGAVFTMGRTNSGSDVALQAGAGHAGLILADEGSHVRTIEGNTSNAVMSRRRRKSSLRGWFAWW